MRAIALCPDGKLLAAASDDGSLWRWDAMTGAAVGSPIRHGSPVTAVCFSVDGSKIATASRDGVASLWDATTGTAIGDRTGKDGEVLAIAFHPDGTTLALAGELGQVQFRDTGSGALLEQSLRHEAAVLGLSFSPDGRRLLSTCADGRARLWETERLDDRWRSFRFGQKGAPQPITPRPVGGDRIPGWNCSALGCENVSTDRRAACASRAGRLPGV